VVFSPDVYNGSQILFPTTRYDGSTHGLEVLVSSGHQWPPPKGAATGDYGGSFSVRRSQWTRSGGYGVVNRPPGGVISRGPFQQEITEISNAPFNPANLPPLINSSTMLAMGTKGWARYKPTRSQGGLDQALGEMHQIPSVHKIRNLKEAFKRAKAEHGWHLPIAWRTNRFLKDASDNYLNYMFGWVPLINDLSDLVVNSVKLESRLKQLIKDNGKPVRRSGPIDSTSSTSAQYFHGNGSDGWLFPGVGGNLTDMKKSVTVQSNTSFRFSGRFRYYINFQKAISKPIGVGSREQYALTRMLYGGEITPQTLYNVMPWSWLIDWVAPLGDLIGNVVNDPIDNLTADYAYVTAKQSTVTQYVVTASGPATQQFETTATLTQELTQRSGASPYGFGLLWSDFSLKQLSILAALGYQKLG
jgi:hypothetical protein